jgi:acetyl esterase/lipase
MTTTRLDRYGDGPDQIADLVLPGGDPPATGFPVVVVIHGGFWRERYRRDLTVPLAEDLAGRGLAAWNLEYRRVPEDQHDTWPATLVDVASGVDRLSTLDAPLDLDAVGVVGHSAGGHLALWVAGRTLLPPGVPGAQPLVTPAAAVGLAPVADLRLAERDGLGDGAPAALLGGSSMDVPERWAAADPARFAGHGVPVLLAHGTQDESVPVSQSEAYATAARDAGDRVEIALDDVDHMSVIEPASPLWQRAVGWLVDRLAGGEQPADRPAGDGDDDHEER